MTKREGRANICHLNVETRVHIGENLTLSARSKDTLTL